MEAVKKTTDFQLSQNQNIKLPTHFFIQTKNSTFVSTINKGNNIGRYIIQYTFDEILGRT